MSVTPYRYAAPQAALDDLRQRLRRCRWPDTLDANGWQQGFALAPLRQLCDYWESDFDWRAQEQRIFHLPHFRYTASDGLGIHCIHRER